ncbi:YbeD family protein [Haliea sp.]|uniref:YbeD family protein n=1 Tax=Haliea sp. TaxID=1932666 RepID=UPI0035298550
MTAQEPPKIEFPCEYPIKVLGRSSEDFRSLIVTVFERHAPGFDQETIVVKGSSKGTFTSLTITITATGPEQLRALHQDLMATGQVQMVI